VKATINIGCLRPGASSRGYAGAFCVFSILLSLGEAGGTEHFFGMQLRHKRTAFCWKADPLPGGTYEEPSMWTLNYYSSVRHHHSASRRLEALGSAPAFGRDSHPRRYDTHKHRYIITSSFQSSYTPQLSSPSSRLSPATLVNQSPTMPLDDPQDAELLSIASSLIPELHQSTKHPAKSILVERDESESAIHRQLDSLSQKDDGEPMDRLLAEGDELTLGFIGRQ
jgi:hypothetical protein